MREEQQETPEDAIYVRRDITDQALAEGAPATCGWLVEAFNGNPEPDSPEDCYTIRECGAPLHYDTGGWACESGHNHRTYGGPEHTEYWDADEIAGRLTW